MNALIQPLNEIEVFDQAKKHLKYKNSHIAITGLSDSQIAHFSYALLPNMNKVIIAPTEKKAKEIVDDLRFFEGEQVLLYPTKDLIFYSADVHSNDIIRSRMRIIEKIIDKEPVTIVLSIEALVDPLIPIDIIKESIIEFEPGTEISISELANALTYMGYERVDLVEGPGQFALRGGLVDIFSLTLEDIIRVEFWGDEVDSIRQVNRETQRTVMNIASARILPAREIVVDKPRIEKAAKNIEKDFETMKTKLNKAKASDVLMELRRTYEKLMDQVQNNGNFNGIESNIYYYFDKTYTLLDYVDNPKVILVEATHIKERINGMEHEYSDSMQTRLEKGYLLPEQVRMSYRFKELLSDIDEYQTIMLSSLHLPKNTLAYEAHFEMNVKSLNVYHQNFELMIKDINYYIQLDYKVVLFTASRTRSRRLAEMLSDHEVANYFVEEETKTLKKGAIGIVIGNIHKGYEFPSVRFAVMAETDISGQKKKKRKRKHDKGNKIREFSELKLGDYIVHEYHGIGVFQGVETIEIDGISKDFIKIGYRDNGNLYISTNQLDAIQKYVGPEGKGPKLHKLGTQEWKRTKAKVKSAVNELATDLIELYAKREQRKGYVYQQDTTWQNEFEEMFPYEETDDQLNAILDTKKDMESTKIMDRLICGDVGYGKTEVAIRAAFKAVQDGKQVAYLVPTTILAQQHYNNFIQRMKDFPIRVDMLSRFRSRKEQKDSIEAIRTGISDIVIGTHRLLSKDIKFKDLGLLIIDEEQRFGVGHKEKIKQVKSDVDVLTLTATPIPRTLHMSLIGIRDMSVLEEPPEERQPIQTYVLEHNDELIKDAIHREIDREGQVYYVYNRVKDIDEVALRIQRLIPEAVVEFAHGQMSERELEDIMVSFINGEIDVLVATTIIETGLDISNVNTIIIQDADHMGLSQLYQLRGRVGRSSRLAYAYLTYRRDKIIKEIAEKRLKAIKEFTEFGSGYRIAMRDLEIRGAGNILGQMQSGHLDAVGYELYCKMLEEALSQHRGEAYEETMETTIDLAIDAFIPPKYISDEYQKINNYKKIASIQSVEDYEDVQDELIDRYGDMPKSVINLLDIALIKGMASHLYILNIEQSGNEIKLDIKHDAKFDPEKIFDVVKKDEGHRRFTIKNQPFFTIILKDKEMSKMLSYIKSLLQDIKELKS